MELFSFINAMTYGITFIVVLPRLVLSVRHEKDSEELITESFHMYMYFTDVFSVLETFIKDKVLFAYEYI